MDMRGIAKNQTMTPAKEHPAMAWWTIGVLAVLKLAVHLYALQGYGIFRDELYYLACAEHLDWG